MRLQIVRNSICTLALTVVLSLFMGLSAAAVDPTQADTTPQAETECIYLVTEPDRVPEDVYYYMDGKKTDPATFTWVDDSVKGKALQLDGLNQYIRLATARVQELSAFTFSAWVNWAGNEGDKEQRLLCVSKNANYSLTVSPHNTDLARQLNGIELTLEDPRIEPISLHHMAPENVSSALQTNKWHHIAVTLSDTDVALYIDGTLYASQLLEGFSVEAMDLRRFVIGSEFDGDAQFKGLLDNALLYTTVLDTNQIALLAQNRDPDGDGKPTNKQEILATKPLVPSTSPANDKSTRILGLSPVVFAILGSGIVLVIVLSLVLTLYRKKTQPWEEEDLL